MNESQERETRNVKVGQQLEVSLESTPSSGAIWYYNPSAGGLSLIDEQRNSLKENIGEEIRQAFRFQACQKGDYELKFELKRAWEQEVRQTRTVVVQIS